MAVNCLIPRPFGSNKVVPTIADEFRTPVMSLFDALAADMFKGVDPFRAVDIKTKAYPKVDVRQDGEDLVFEAAVPFVDKEDLDVSINDGTLVISGTVKKDKKVEEGDFVVRELVRSSFARSFPLHEKMYEAWNARDGTVTADLDNGVLTVKLMSFLESCENSNECDVRKINIK